MYRTIDAAFWTDPLVRSLDPLCKLLFLYLITNPHTHVSGIYYLPRSLMSTETTLAPRSLNTLCDTLSRLGFCSFDPERELIWVRNMMKYQGSGEKNVRSAAYHVAEDLHKSPLVKEFCEFYPAVKKIVLEHFPDTLSDTVSTLRTPDPRSLIPDPDLRVHRPDTLSTAKDAGGYSAEFEIFWKVYPVKTGKGDAFKSWQKNGHPPVEEMVATIERAKRSPKWKEQNGRFIPNPATWLNQKRWDDEYSSKTSMPDKPEYQG